MIAVQLVDSLNSTLSGEAAIAHPTDGEWRCLDSTARRSKATAFRETATALLMWCPRIPGSVFVGWRNTCFDPKCGDSSKGVILGTDAIAHACCEIAGEDFFPMLRQVFEIPA